jgi:hypothetical protein
MLSLPKIRTRSCEPETSPCLRPEHIFLLFGKQILPEEVILPEGVSFETSMLKVEEKSKLALVLAVFDEFFQQTLSPDSKAKRYGHHIATGDHLPIRIRQYSVSFAEKDFVETEVQKLVEPGMVQPSSSPWASPIVLVPKKNGEILFFWIIGS